MQVFESLDSKGHGWLDLAQLEVAMAIYGAEQVSLVHAENMDDPPT